MNNKIKLKAVSLSANSIWERFNVELENDEWVIFEREIKKSWSNMDYGLEKVIVDHIRNSLIKLDYKPVIKNSYLSFEKIMNQ